MSKLKNIKKFAIFLIFFSLIFLLNLNSAYAWLSGFQYRRAINITNSGSTTLTDYQVLITLNTQTLISTGKMRNDCGDIRFALPNNTLLSYWIEEGCNTASTRIWVKVPSIPASSTTTIYVYYGNPSATSLSNGTATFDFFDDFNDYTTTSVTEKGRWFVGVDSVFSVDTVNKRLYVNNPSGGFGKWISAVKGGSNITVTSGIIEVKVYNNGGANELAIMVRAQSNPQRDTYVFFESTAGSPYWRIGKRLAGSSYNVVTSTASPVTGTWMTWRITFYGNTLKFVSSHGLTTELTGTDTSFSSGMIGIFTWGNTISYVDDFILRKYASPEPTTSIGVEEANNQPPQITIYSPLNQTYFYSNNFVFNFSVNDDRSTSFVVRVFLDNVLIYENTSYQNNTIVVLTRNLTQLKTYNFTVWANDAQGLTSRLTIIFTIKDFEISSVEYEQYPYETKDYNYSITFRYNPDLVRNITSRLNWNNQQLVDANITFKNSTHIKNTATFTFPLVQQNNTQVSFRFVNDIYYTNNSFQTVESNAYNQNITFAYWIDSISSDRNDYIEFEDATIRLNVRDKVGKASLSATITFVYNSTYNVSRDLLTYSILNQDLKSFNYTFDTLESFSDNETRSYFANLTVSFHGESRVMNSPVQQLRVYKIILTNCSVYPTKALTLFLRDEETDKPLLNATIEATFNVWKTGEIKRNYAWKFDLINTDNQSICIYPSWAEYSIDAMLQYYKDGYMDRTYFIHTKINNQTSGVNLYLLNANLGNIIVIYVVDENGNKVQGAIVKIQRYYAGSNSYKTVAQVKTDYEGKGVTFLRVNEIYYRFIIEKNFTVVRETEPTIIVCTTGGCPPYPVTLSISEQKSAKYFRYTGKIAYACQINEETNILRCTVDDTSQLMQKARLLVERKGALKFDALCDNICESSACTITCNLGNMTNNIYRYILSAYIPEQIILEQNILDYKQALIIWGAQGLLITFLITSTLFFVGIWNPVTAMVFALIGIIAGYLLGFTPVSISSLIGLALAIGILIYKMRV